MRFQRIDLDDKELMDDIIHLLNKKGYIEIPNNTGGDENFIVIDSIRKEYIWCEYGFAPFCSEHDLIKCSEYNKNLKELENSNI